MDKICQQDQDISTIDWKQVQAEKEALIMKRNISFKAEQENIIKERHQEQGSCLRAASEKGAFLLLSALPLKKLDHVLNKNQIK